MNGLELQEFPRRMEALSEEEQKMAAEKISDEIMFQELSKRSEKRQEIIRMVEKSLKLGKEE